MDSIANELNTMTSIAETFLINTARYNNQSDAPNMSRTGFWREFCSGMTMFKQRIGHTNADLTNVVRMNLKLLHKNFLSNNEYRHYLHETKHDAIKTWALLARDQNTLCGILALSGQNTVSLHDTVISQMASSFQLEDDGQGKKCLIMIYVIEGRLAIEHQAKASMSKSLLKYTCEEKTLRKVLKQGDAGIQHTSNEMNLLRSASHSCQLLVVAVPTPRVVR